jgi:hypothetical protein
MAAAAAARHLCALRRSCLMSQTGEKHGVTVQDRPLKGAWSMTALIFLLFIRAEIDRKALARHALPAPSVQTARA